MRIAISARLFVASASILGLCSLWVGQIGAQVPGDRPVLTHHVDQAAIDSRQIGLRPLVEQGRFLFSAKFNKLDGYGRPASTGNGTPTKRAAGSAPSVIRTSGPESNSCAGCHNDPEPGGAGDFVANVFVLAQVLDPVTDSVSAEFSNERNTLGMHGSGAIEALAVEMTRELMADRDAALQQAQQAGKAITRRLVAKGVDFGSLVAKPDGTVDTTGVEGVDADLIIKPFHQKGVVNSVRVFTVNAYKHHHGMQAVERFGAAMTGSDDFDEDGVKDELSVGDITAATVFQAALSVPQQVMPVDPQQRQAVLLGEKVFSQIGCGGCHRPALILNSPLYSEPNPFNPPGNLRVKDVTRPFSFDLTREGLGRRLERLPDGRAVVRAYTDLKRHRICDESDQFFNNERKIQGGVPTDVFLTRKLWDCGSSAPYGIAATAARSAKPSSTMPARRGWSATGSWRSVRMIRPPSSHF